MKLKMTLTALSAVAAMVGLTAMAQTSAPSGQFSGGSPHEEGPLYTRAQLHERQVIGMRLGMGFTEAHALAVENGFTPQSRKAIRDWRGRFDMHFVKPSASGGSEHLVLSYEPDGPRQISSIRYMRPLTEAPQRQVGAQRQAILKAYGAPSEWSPRVDQDGAIRDQFAYVVLPALRDANARQVLSSCHAGWRYEYECQQLNCRHPMAEGREPVLSISFGDDAVSYSWDDYEARYPASTRGLGARLIRPKTEQCRKPPTP